MSSSPLAARSPQSEGKETRGGRRRRRRFAIVDCEDEVELAYVAIAYARLLSNATKEDDEEGEEEVWEHHRVPEGELPNANEIEEYDGIVITGSRHSAMDAKSMRWMKHLKQFLERVTTTTTTTNSSSPSSTTTENNKKKKKQTPPRIFAVNFGAHVLCEALGGKVRRRNNSSNDREEPEAIGKFTCEFDADACEKAFPKSVWSGTRAILEERKKQKMKMVSMQRDEICELPEGAVMLTNAVVDDDSDNSSDEENETETTVPKPVSVFQPVEHEFSKFIPERQKQKIAETSAKSSKDAHDKEKKAKQLEEEAKKKKEKNKALPYSSEAVCCWAWSPSFTNDDKDGAKSKARVMAWQHTLLRDEEEEKKKKDYDPESDPSIAFLSLARAFLRSKDDEDEDDENESGVAYLNDTKTSLSKCLQAARETIEAKSLDQWKKKSIVRDEDGNAIEHDENEVVVLGKMESVAEQAFLATAKAVKSELDYASEEFRLYSSLNEVAKNAFERRTKEISDVRVFVKKIVDTEKKIHNSILPTIEALEKQVALFEKTVENAEKRCDEIDARIAKLL